MTGRGRPTTGTKIEVRIPADMLAELDAEGSALGIGRAEYVRRVLATRHNSDGRWRTADEIVRGER
jgi:hypothetical protein